MYGIAISGRTMHLVTIHDLYQTTIGPDVRLGPLERLLYNVPAGVTTQEEGLPGAPKQEVQRGALQGRNSRRSLGTRAVPDGYSTATPSVSRTESAARRPVSAAPFM